MYICEKSINLLKITTMKTITKNQNSADYTYLIVIGSALIIFGIIGFIFHISPKEIALALSEFAEHHYLLMSFISFVLGMFTIGYYYDLKLTKNEFISKTNKDKTKKS